MKKKTTKIVAISGVGVLLISGIATGIGYLQGGSQPNPSSDTNVSTSDKLSKEEQEQVITELVEKANLGYRPTEIEAELRKNVEKLSEKNSTRVVREFMSSIEATSSYFVNLLYLFGPELEYAKLSDGVEDPIKEKGKVSSQLVNGFVDEIERQHLNIIQGDGYYYLEPDAAYVLKKYGEYTHGDYKDYLNLASKQQTDPIFDEEKSSYNLDRIRDDLVYIDNARDRWSDGDFADDFTNMEIMLYKTMFSVNHATFFDLNIENEGEENEDWVYTLKDEVRQKYEKLIQENSDMSFVSELEKFLNILKENDYKLNDKVDKFLEEMFKEKFGSSLTEGSVEESSDSEGNGETPESDKSTEETESVSK